MEDCDDANVIEPDECDTDCKPVVHRKVFVSSGKYDGNLGGLSGADIRCNTLAQLVGLSGTFKAWLSDAATGPADRFDTSFTGVYELIDGSIVAHGWADLTDGSLMHAIDLSEKNAPLDTAVWTSTDPSGGPNGTDHCLDWTSSQVALDGWYGFSSASDTSWTQSLEGLPCSSAVNIYCFEDPD